MFQAGSQFGNLSSVFEGSSERLLKIVVLQEFQLMELLLEIQSWRPRWLYLAYLKTTLGDVRVDLLG